MKPHELKPDDLVRWTRKFLRSTGQYTGAPIDGRVERIIQGGCWDGWPVVQWCHAPEGEAHPVNPANLQRAPDHRRRSAS